MSARGADTKSASKNASRSREVLPTGSDAPSAPRRGRSQKKAKQNSKSNHRVDELIAATAPLLSLFSVCDDVFTEEDALTTYEHQRQTIGRIYEEWKRCRRAFDPDFHPADHLRARTVKKKGLSVRPRA